MPGGEDGIRDGGFNATTGFDVSDENPRFLARRLDSFVGEMRLQLQDFGTRLDTKLDAFTTMLSDIKSELGETKRRVDHVEQKVETTVARVDEHDKQISAIKAQLPKKRRRAKTARSRKPQRKARK